MNFFYRVYLDYQKKRIKKMIKKALEKIEEERVFIEKSEKNERYISTFNFVSQRIAGDLKNMSFFLSTKKYLPTYDRTLLDSGNFSTKLTSLLLSIFYGYKNNL